VRAQLAPEVDPRFAGFLNNFSTYESVGADAH
jgi:hypothetical protein